MTQDEFQNIITISICNVDLEHLQKLDENKMYFTLSKAELIEDFKVVFQDLISKGINKLSYKRTTCKYCYANARAYEFYDENQRFHFRYIIDIDKKGNNIVRLCHNESTLNRTFDKPF